MGATASAIAVTQAAPLVQAEALQIVSHALTEVKLL
jgi:hypothetical protein